MTDRPAERASTTLIGTGAAFEGLLTFRGTVRVDGRLQGRVVAEGRLEIGPEASVQADIEVDELVVAGEVQGTLQARRRLELQERARVVGSLRAPRLVIASGCRFEGRCDTAPVPSRERAGAPSTQPSAP